MFENGSWEIAYQGEIELAEQARSSGNEGMARVCARRAAGIIIGEYFARSGIQERNRNAYERIAQLRGTPGIPKDVQEIVDHLLQRVNSDHNLPFEADLILETRQLAEKLLARNQSISTTGDEP